MNSLLLDPALNTDIEHGRTPDPLDQMGMDLALALANEFHGLTKTTSIERPSLVDHCPDTLKQFVQAYPFEVDNHPFTFANRDYLEPIFDEIRFDQGDHFSFVLMTGAQVAKSITAMLSMVLASIKFWGSSFGYFLPDQEMTMIFSSKRFLPILLSCLPLRPLVGTDPITGKKGEDRKRVRTLGQSTIYFSYMGGKTSTESLPLSGIWFDEVRRMAMQDVERASERISAAQYPINAKISTAKHPGSDIDRYYKRSTMGKWHSACRCKDGVILADTFPNCIGELNGQAFYRCPKCDKRIDRPATGRFIHHQPESDTKGWQIPQLLSPLWTAPRFWGKWMDATDKAEFYNSGLGLPYLDPDSILVTPEIAWGCVDPELHWMSHGVNCVMGVDQRGLENHVIIGRVGKAKFELLHIEIIQSDKPFKRLREMMVQYDVDCCVGDALPNYNEAVRFAKAFPRRVFLSYYTDNMHMVRWSDRDEELKALARAGKDSKFQYHVMLDRYKTIEWALMHWVNRKIACPNPHGLTQQVRVKGMAKSVEVCLGNRDSSDPGLFWHMESISRRKVEIQRRDAVKKDTLLTGEFKMVWENVGIDPHFVHALGYALVAGSRKMITDQILFMDAPRGATNPIVAEEVQNKRPKVSLTQAGDQAQFETKIIPQLVQTIQEGTCGSCENFQGENQPCMAREFLVQASMPAGDCWAYDPKAEEDEDE